MVFFAPVSATNWPTQAGFKIGDLVAAGCRVSVKSCLFLPGFSGKLFLLSFFFRLEQVEGFPNGLPLDHQMNVCCLCSLNP